MTLLSRPREVRVLVRTHRQYLACLEAASGGTAQRLYTYYEKPVKRAIRDAEPACSPFFWLLSGRKRKLQAMSACNYLWDCELLGLGREIRKL